MNVRHWLRATLFVAALSITGSASTLRGEELEQVLARFDRVQESVRSLSADFTMTTESELLKDRIVAQGRIYLTKPAAVRWEFITPEEMRFVIADNVYTGYFPVQKRAEKRDVQRWGEQLFRFLGLGQASGELSKFYDISLAEGDGGSPGTISLLLEPKKRRVRKKMESVRLSVDSSTFLPVQVDYASKGGDRRSIVFENMEMNPQLAANLYTVDLPPDVEVTKGFSAFPGFGPTSTE